MSLNRNIVHESVSHLVYDKLSGGILTVFIPKDAASRNEYFYYESFIEYMESFLFYEFDKSLGGIIDNVDHPIERKRINYIQHLDAMERACVSLSWDFLNVYIEEQDKYTKDNCGEYFNDNISKRIKESDSYIAEELALICLKKYFADADKFEEIGNLFWKALCQKMKYEFYVAESPTL